MPSEQWRRHDVVARLTGHLTETGAERRSIVMRGPAGIGKSYLARAVASSLATAGVPVRRAAGGAAQRHLAFGALVHLLDVDDTPISIEFELIQRLRSALIAQAATAVLVVDDVALLDDQSAGLIESVMLQGDVVVLATERTLLGGEVHEHNLSSALRAHAEVVEVPPLTDDEVMSMVVGWLGPGELSSIRRLGARSQGNPMVLRELVSAAQAAGAVVERDGLWHLEDFRASGHSIDRLVREHLDRLSESEWELLRCLAVAETLPRRVAARIDVESLEHLERVGLLRSDPTVIGQRLYGEVILDSLSPEQIRRVCSKLVSAIGPDDAVDAARLGSWLLRAEHELDPGLARRGAALALARWENDLARRLILSIAEPETCDLVQLIWAHANVGNLDEAVAASQHARSVASTDAEIVAAGLATAELWALQLHRRNEAYAMLADLRGRVDDPALLAKIDAATSLYSRMTGNRHLAAASAQSASSARVDDDAAVTAVLLGTAFDKVFGGRFDEAEDPIRRGLVLAEQRSERHIIVRFEIAEALRCLLSGRTERSRALVSDALALADLAGVRPAHVVWLGLASQLAQLDGDFEVAQRRAREAVRAGDLVDDFGAAGFVRGDLCALEIEFGATSETCDGSSRIGLARAQVRLADVADADDLAAGLANETAESGYGLWAPWVAWEAVRRGPAPRCSSALQNWADDVEGPVVTALAEHAMAVVDDDWRRARAAAHALLAIGFVTPSFDALLAAAEIRSRTEPASSEVRRFVLELAALAARIVPGLPPRLAARLADVDAACDMPSERQLEIARLAASGRASKEIAAELVVSVRTVDNHLAAVYRMFDVSGRHELAALELGDHPGALRRP
ncbi:MAG: LuxR C-terminal-related transcriptional regulator [Ilumatobacter sp.]|jgi:DNA-binding CsgD family transcriptional regulator/type II secretory pathway predicted ATPase ExeA|uniref:helix-turn-helix transcriptional regulator n=1 Tax=Ilumatobacter sp. TaxID=1967498 RepID=UPI00391D9221